MDHHQLRAAVKAAAVDLLKTPGAAVVVACWTPPDGRGPRHARVDRLPFLRLDAVDAVDAPPDHFWLGGRFGPGADPAAGIDAARAGAGLTDVGHLVTVGAEPDAAGPEVACPEVAGPEVAGPEVAGPAGRPDGGSADADAFRWVKVDARSPAWHAWLAAAGTAGRPGQPPRCPRCGGERARPAERVQRMASARGARGGRPRPAPAFWIVRCTECGTRY